MMTRRLLIILVMVVSSILPMNAFGGAESATFLTVLSCSKDVGLMRHIGGVFFDETTQRLYLSDTSNSRLLAYDSQFNYLSALKPGGDLKAPTSFLRESDGRFFVVQPSSRQVLEIDTQRKTITPVALSSVSGPVYPDKLTMDSNGNIYLTDKAQGRVLMFDPRMKFRKEILRESNSPINDIKLDKEGNVYTLSTVEGRIRKYDSSGRKLLEFGSRGKQANEFYFPVSLAVDSRGLIHVADQHKATIMVFDQTGKFRFDYGKFGWKQGRLSTPSYIAINNVGTIFVVDRGNSRISIFQ